MMAAGTMPPRVMAMMPLKEPADMRRQARALASRCSSHQETGKVLSGALGFTRASLSVPDLWGRIQAEAVPAGNDCCVPEDPQAAWNRTRTHGLPKQSPQAKEAGPA